MSIPTAIADSRDREHWMEQRDGLVTASDGNAIASGSRRTWRRILDDKLNGRVFQGNSHTARGHEREPFILAAIAELLPDLGIQPSGLLFVADDEVIGATPDGVGRDDEGAFGVEAKSRLATADLSKIPADHLDQMLLGMYVLDVDRWLYVVERMGADGTPTLDDPHWQWVPRDDARIAVLVEKAHEFQAWREAGAPEFDRVEEKVATVIADWITKKATTKAHEAAEKKAEALVRKAIKAHPGAASDGWKVETRGGGFNYSVTTKNVLDEAAWESAEPESFAEVQRMEAAITAHRAAAALLYRKPQTTTRLLPVFPEPEETTE